MQTRHTDRSKYFQEQEHTTRKYVIPFIEQFREVSATLRVIEIGCGEGGNLIPFLDAGCKVTGIDLSRHKIDLAESFLANHPLRNNLTLLCDDIYDTKVPEEKYDLVIMRDVIEHIHDQNRFMKFVKAFLHPGSLFFLAFPPWQNPFGGHQQVCRSKILSHLPWFHLLPAFLYGGLLRLFGESQGTVTNLLEVKETGISIERFESVLKDSGYSISNKIHFFINPNYEVKFGLKPRKQGSLITAIPWVRNFLTTSAYYIVTPQSDLSGPARLQDQA